MLSKPAIDLLKYRPEPSHVLRRVAQSIGGILPPVGGKMLPIQLQNVQISLHI